MSKGGRKALVDPLPVDNLEKAEQPRINDESDPKVENVAPPADSYDEYEADWSAPVQDPCGGLATDAGDEMATEASPQAGSSTDAAGGLDDAFAAGECEDSGRVDDPSDAKTLVMKSRTVQTTERVKVFLETHHGGVFDYNDKGQHAIHRLCDLMVDPKYEYDSQLWRDLIELTSEQCPQGINTQTRVDGQPPLATALAMAAKRKWTCQRVQGPREQIQVVEWMVAKGADVNARSQHGNSVIMEVAGGGNVPMFQYFWERIREGLLYIDLEARNRDGRNLYALSGCAEDDDEEAEAAKGRVTKKKRRRKSRH